MILQKKHFSRDKNKKEIYEILKNEQFKVNNPRQCLVFTTTTVVVATTAQLNSTKPELRFCAGSKAGYGLPEIAMVRTSDIGPG